MSQGSEQQSGWGHQCVPGCGFSVTSTIQRSASHGNTCAGCHEESIYIFEYYLHELKPWRQEEELLLL